MQRLSALTSLAVHGAPPTALPEAVILALTQLRRLSLVFDATAGRSLDASPELRLNTLTNLQRMQVCAYPDLQVIM